ncbi:putative translation initiation factor eIF-2B subunit delta [Podospora conica]|nr:putative translation initiation factor eIF-2B subunit delta [Schizothecium conicum]
MATESAVAPVAAVAPPAGSQSAPAPAPAPATAPAATPAEAPKLTPAQLKAKAKEEKAARRAQAKEVKAATGGQAPAAPDAKGGKGKGKQDGSQAAGQQSQKSLAHRPSVSGRRPSFQVVEKEKDTRSVIPECFSHVPMAKRIPTAHAHKDVHPAVLAVGQQMAAFTLKDSIGRLQATLLAFKKVLEAYETPKGNSLSRHFVPHVLNPQIEYLTECRPMSFSMGNAIRILKAKVNSFDIDTDEEEAKEGLLELIDLFIKERINLAEFVIARNASKAIEDGATVLTYGRHRLVEKTLLRAKRDGRVFVVSIIDDPYDNGGQDMAKSLSHAGIPVSYSPNLGGLRAEVQRASHVLLGVEAIFANGSLYGAAGTADVAVAAKGASKKVIALCETINFDRERVSVDALTYNEIDPEQNSAENFRLLYDTTRDTYLTGVITEFESGTGNSPAQAILALLRKQEDPALN